MCPTHRICGVTVLLCGVGVAWAQRPPHEVLSENKQFVVQIEAGRPGRAGRSCQATLLERAEKDERGRMVWERPLVNDVAPAIVCVRNDGRTVVTLDEYRRGGARNALVIYGPDGELLRHFLLPDLLRKDDWSHVRVDRRSLVWLDKARYGFDEPDNQFVIALAWGPKVRIDLKTLRVTRGDMPTPDEGVATIPAAILALLARPPEREGDQAIGEHLDGLKELTPDEQHRAAEIAANVGAQSPAERADTLAEATTQPAPGESPANAATQAAETAAATPSADQPTMTAAPEPAAEPPQAVVAAEPVVPPQNSALAAVADMMPPAPNPAQKVDYVTWLNQQVAPEGADASRIYTEASGELTPFPGGDELLVAAERGDVAALQSPELGAWLAANRGVLEKFSAASQLQSLMQKYASPDGSLIGVQLPNLGNLRKLAKLSIVDGRRAAAEGRPDEAAARYLDVMAAGAQAGRGMTMIEHLVGVATQSLSANALLDLQAGAPAGTLDYVGLAAEAEAAAQPPRAPVEGLQGERAMFLDSAQRLWDVDPQSGQPVLNVEWGRQLFENSGIAQDGVSFDAIAGQLAQAGFGPTVAEANTFYDAMTEAMALPYPEAAPRLAEISQLASSDRTVNPMVRTFIPALDRYMFVRTRGEAARRAAVLVTNLNAYRQQTGDYPSSLDALGSRDFVRDPFTNQPFAYRRDGNSFTLYSLGGNGTDEGGVHDARGETNDVVFWPRPK
jgi:hypothetical protein